MNLNKFFQKTLLNCNLAIKDKNAEQLNFNTTQIKNSNKISGRHTSGNFGLLAQQRTVLVNTKQFFLTKKIIMYHLLKSIMSDIENNNSFYFCIHARCFLERLSILNSLKNVLVNYEFDQINSASKYEEVYSNIEPKLSKFLLQTKINPKIFWEGFKNLSEKDTIYNQDEFIDFQKNSLGKQTDVENEELYNFQSKSIMGFIREINEKIPDFKNCYGVLCEIIHPSSLDTILFSSDLKTFSYDKYELIKRSFSLYNSNSVDKTFHSIFKDINDVLSNALKYYVTLSASIEKKIDVFNSKNIKYLHTGINIKKKFFKANHLCPCLSGLKIKNCAFRDYKLFS